MDSILKTSEEWYKSIHGGITILDPDGWDRGNYQFSWYQEKIDRKEFKRRVLLSTLQCYTQSAIEIFQNEW